MERKGSISKATPGTRSSTTLFNDSFFFLLKPWEMVMLRTGTGPISWPERLQILHLMEANHWCMSSQWHLGFWLSPLAHIAQKAWLCLLSRKPCHKLEKQSSPSHGNVASSPPAAASTIACWAEEPALRQPSLQHPNKPSADYKGSNNTLYSPNTAKYSPKYYKMLLSLSSCNLPSCH